MNKKSFTLLELLAVIAIIGIVAAMLLPATHKAIQKAKESRAKAEMALLATTIMEVYSEVGYYVRLEDIAKPDLPTYPTTTINNWTKDDYTDGKDDNEVTDTEAQALWAGPYTTHKNFVVTTVPTQKGKRPTDPWGQEYRMFWSTNADIKPAGASGTMVIISAGSDKLLNNFGNASPATATIDTSFNPNNDNDLYFNFNAGIQ